MTRGAQWAILAAFFIAGTIFVYRKDAQHTLVAPEASSLGTYAYLCDHNTELEMSLSGDASAMHLKPLGSTTSFISGTLQEQAATSGARYVGAGLTFTAHGESVQLRTASSTIECVPAQVSDEAPFNFGD